MDYAIEMQRIIDALKADKAASPKWRNKISARLEELQAFSLLLYERPSVSEPMPFATGGIIQNPGPTLVGEYSDHIISLDEIPESLREHVDPSRLRLRTPPGTV